MNEKLKKHGRWQPVFGAKDFVNGPKSDGLYDVTLARKEKSGEFSWRYVEEAEWLNGLGFVLPVESRYYRVLAWRDAMEHYTGPVYLSPAEERRLAKGVKA